MAAQMPPLVGGGTVVEALCNNVRRIPERPALRRRVPGGWETWSWADYGRGVAEVAAGLAELGVGPSEQVAILSDNRLEWHLADLGALALGAVTVPVYPTSSAQQVAYVLDHSEARACFVASPEMLAKVLEVRDRLPKLHRVVIFENSETLNDPFLAAFSELRAVGAQRLEREPELFDDLGRTLAPERVASIVYTSGTTGPPKGVVLTHDNIMWVLRSMLSFLEVREGERFLSFLPLSHVAERMVSEFAAIAVGGETWFARSLAAVAEDLVACRPTIFFAVPRVWEKLQEAVVARVRSAPAPQRLAVEWYLRLGERIVARHQAGSGVPSWEQWAHGTLNRTLGERIRRDMGLDCAHLLASTAAPAHPELLRWFHGIGLPVVELYGQTETCGPTTCNPPHDIRIGTVGPPIPGVQVTIAADNEVLVRGGNVCHGYFRDAKGTTELIDADGWLHSGDLGTLEDGYLRITGRKKDLIITAAGQNISPQLIESDLQHHPLVSEAMVVGEGRRYLTALLALDPEALAGWARRHDKVAEYEALASDPDVHKEIARLIEEVNAKRSRVEGVRKYRILDRELTVASNELTPTYKLRRDTVAERFRGLIEEMYQEDHRSQA